MLATHLVRSELVDQRCMFMKRTLSTAERVGVHHVPGTAIESPKFKSLQLATSVLVCVLGSGFVV